MRHSFLGAKRHVTPILFFAILLAACRTPKTVPETPEIVREEDAAPPVAEEQSVSQAAATYTPFPTYTPYPTYTALPTATVVHAATATGTAGPTVVPPTPVTGQAVSETATAIPTATEIVASATATPPAEIPVDAPTRPPVDSSAIQAPAPELRLRQDTDPGPPFTIRLSRVHSDNDRFKLTGWVRNDGSEIYEGIGVVVTLINDAGVWLGATDAHCPCPFLEPGAECPFSLETYPGDYVEVLLHPEGRPVEHRRPAELLLSDLNLSDDGIGHVRFRGTAINENPFTVRDAVIAGMLLDGNGQLVSLGSTLVRGEISPGGQVTFDLRIKQEPYARYQLHVQAVRN